MPTQQPPANVMQEGDILVEALYAPAKKQGPRSERMYPRTGNRRRLYVDPRDVAARPDWWQVPPEVQAQVISPAVDEVTALAQEALMAAEAEKAALLEAPSAADKADDEGDIQVDHEEYPTNADETPEAEAATGDEVTTAVSTSKRRRK